MNALYFLISVLGAVKFVSLVFALVERIENK